MARVDDEPPGTGAPGPEYSLLSSLKLVKMACGECWAYFGSIKIEKSVSEFVDNRNRCPIFHAAMWAPFMELNYFWHGRAVLAAVVIVIVFGFNILDL